MLGSVQQRLGGAGVVQFARAPTGKPFALKFFVHRAGFERVTRLFAERAVNALMPAVKGVVPNRDREAHAGQVLPPCVVMHAGEPLEGAWFFPCSFPFFFFDFSPSFSSLFF